MKLTKSKLKQIIKEEIDRSEEKNMPTDWEMVEELDDIIPKLQKIREVLHVRSGVFEEKVGDMTLVEMQELAVTVGVFPSGTRTSLKNKLLKAFRDYQRGSSSFVVPSSASICPDADRESDKFKKALGLMKEGL